jgi:hypothetical protein
MGRLDLYGERGVTSRGLMAILARALPRLHLAVAAEHLAVIAGLTLVFMAVFFAGQAIEGRAPELPRGVALALPVSALLGTCVMVARLRAQRLEVALSALGRQPLYLAAQLMAVGLLLSSLPTGRLPGPPAASDDTGPTLTPTLTIDERSVTVQTSNGQASLTFDEGGARRDDVSGVKDWPAPTFRTTPPRSGGPSPLPHLLALVVAVHFLLKRPRTPSLPLSLCTGAAAVVLARLTSFLSA